MDDNGLLATADSGDQKQYKKPPAETHLARCVWVIALGTQNMPQKDGSFKKQKRVKLSFELPNCKDIFNEERGLEPFMVSAEYTLSLYGSSWLAVHLQAWLGVTFSQEERKIGYDVSKLADMVCMLGVVHTKDKKGNLWANVSSITKLMAGLEVPPAHNEIRVFTISETKYNEEVFEKLPKKTKEKIMESDEWKTIHNTKTEGVDTAPTNEGVDAPETISFNNNEGVDAKASTASSESTVKDDSFSDLPF